MSIIESFLKKDLQYNERTDYHKNLLKNIQSLEKTISFGGGKEAIEKLHKNNKLHARERINLLLDKNSDFFEIGTFAAYGMYEEYGGAPSSGTVFGIGKIEGRDCVIVANDATVKAGAWFPITVKKNLRAQEIAMENHLPIIYLVDSAGVFLPLQDEIFPDKEHFGRIFRNNAIMSSMGIPQIAAIMGPCVAGGAYLPIMSDEILIVKGTGSVFLAGPHLVKAAIGETIDIESLGGAEVSANISGITDEVMENDEECILKIRSLVSKFGKQNSAGFDRIKPELPKYDPKEIYGILPVDNTKPYDSYELIARIVDGGQIDEYKPGYGQSLITIFARIDGWAVGIVANQRNIIKKKNSKGGIEMLFGGVIYSDSADKAARFIMNCNQRKIPLVFLQDVTGFMVGSQSEHNGIIKDGAKLVNAMSNSVVPKFTVVIGNSYGAGNYAMCGKAYDPRLIVGWPTAEIAVMGGAQAAKVLVQIEVASRKAKGEEITEKEEKELFNKIKSRYDEQTTPYYAAARLWLDAIIDPIDTRKVISMGIEMADHAPAEKPYNVGVIQT